VAFVGIVVIAIGAIVPEAYGRQLIVYAGGALVVTAGLVGIRATYRFYLQDRRERAAGYTTTDIGWFYLKY
jgi:hypothetical protein